MSDINKCEPWCGLEYGNKNVPDAWIGPDAMPFGVPQYGDGPDGEDALLMPAYCTQTCYERAPTTKLRLAFEAAGGAEAFIAAPDGRMEMNLLPCPFCGTDVVRLSGDAGSRCKCAVCGSLGPWGVTEARAIEAWNRRAEPKTAEKPANNLGDEHIRSQVGGWKTEPTEEK